MEPLILWKILAETTTEFIEFPIQVSHDVVKDGEIKSFIREQCEKHNVTTIADDVEELLFVCVSDEISATITEGLPIDEFWPYPAAMYSDETYLKIRRRSGGKYNRGNGGEK